jgi:hypothetical protein
MRTTINLEEDVFRAVRSLARESGDSLGTVVSRLVRQALRPSSGIRYEMKVPVFSVREGAPPITSEMVRSALEES